MGFRFRRSVRIMPGVRLNFSKSGVSTSLGGRGATVNVGPRGTRTTVGLPGTGVSYSQLHPGGAGGSPPGARNGNPIVGCLGVGFVGFVLLLLVGMCSHGNAPAAAPAPVAADNLLTPTAPQPVTQSVWARRASCRADSEASARAIVMLHRGDAVEVTDHRDGWLRVHRQSGDCWISTLAISASPGPPATSSGAGLAPARTYSSPGYNSGQPLAPYTPARHVRPAGRGLYGSGGSGCSCASHSVCTGPRGGRYCITSGGNKRYGM